MSKTSGLKKSCKKSHNLHDGLFFALGKRKYDQVISEKEKMLIEEFRQENKETLKKLALPIDSNSYESEDELPPFVDEDISFDSDESMDDKKIALDNQDSEDDLMTIVGEGSDA
jgi:hypothetical protein